MDRSGAGPASHGGERPPLYRLIYNDDGFGSLVKAGIRGGAAVTGRDLIAEAVEPLVGTHVDALFWSVGFTDVVAYPSQVAELVGANATTFRTLYDWHYHHATKELIARGEDPLRLIVEEGHGAGLAVYASLRMNDVHDRFWHHLLADYKQQHPELLLGELGRDYDRLTDAYWQSTAYNFLHAAVRQHHLGVLAEVAQGYDVDGLELDFLRAPVCFPPEEGEAQRHTMTAFVRQIRRMVQERAARRGRPLFLAVRVGDTAAQSRGFGCDVETWLQQGLVDIVVIGGGYRPFGAPYRELAALAHAHGRAAYACFNSSTNSLRRPDQCRAAAYRAWRSGVDGLYLFNHNFLPDLYGLSREDARVLHAQLDELGDPEALAGRTKTYTLDLLWKVWFQSSASPYRHASAAGVLPLTIAPASDGIGQAVTFDVADSLTPSQPGPTDTILRLTFLNLGPEDRLALRWNHHDVTPREVVVLQRGVARDRREQHVVPLAPGLVHHGENRLDIDLRQRASYLTPFVTLESAELTLEYA